MDIAAVAGLPRRADPGPLQVSAASRVRYVEDKRADWGRVQEILTLSERARQWANFGPVALALERALEHVLALPAERAVVACASATVGLQALAGLHAVKRGRPLRWAVCDYTFFSQRTGIFADAIAVDCGEDGIVDLDALAALPDESWDGLVVTNLFAGLPDLGRFARFCAARGKALIADSAAALFGPDRAPDGTGAGHPDEAISFHHTKPWGLGEGGCVIVDRRDVPLIRAALNFGVGGPDLLKRFSGNGKISDIASAPILERLERLSQWAPSYQAQRARIEDACANAGLPLLIAAPRAAILASVPVLAARTIGAGDVADFGFDLGKYYPPLGGGVRARRLFARIVNIPSHAGMAAIGTDAIAGLLAALSKPG